MTKLSNRYFHLYCKDTDVSINLYGVAWTGQHLAVHDIGGRKLSILWFIPFNAIATSFKTMYFRAIAV